MSTIRISSLEEAAKHRDKSRERTMSGEEIARAVEEDPDAAPILSAEEMREAIATGELHSKLTPEEIVAIREALGLSRAKFARIYRIPLQSLKNWETGARRPDTAGDTLMRVIRQKASAVRRALADDQVGAPTEEDDAMAATRVIEAAQELAKQNEALRKAVNDMQDALARTQRSAE